MFLELSQWQKVYSWVLFWQECSLEVCLPDGVILVLELSTGTCTPYFPCKFSPIMLQVEAWELCFLGYFGSRLPGWRGSATEMLSHGIAKVEEEQTVFFPVLWQWWWADEYACQMPRCAWLPFHPCWSWEQLRSNFMVWFGGMAASSFCGHKPETYAARPDFCSSSLSNSFMAPS